MALADYVRNFNISLPDLARIQHRVMVVGQFNDDPDVKAYLFSHRCGQDPEYEANFAASCDLEYRNFIQELRPSLREVINLPRPDFAREYSWFGLQRPSSVVGKGVAGESRSSSVINEADYFFVRAASSSDQEWYRDQAGKADLLTATDNDRGRQILVRIRKQLATFSRFQSDTPKLVHGLMQTLSDCASLGLPFYAPGAPLPGGLAEAVVDLLFDEDVTKRLDLDRISFRTPDGVWDVLHGNEDMQRTLQVVVQAYRDRMRGKAALYNDHMVFGQPIGDVIDGIIEDDQVLGEDYRERFREAQEAYSELRQILKNKALLGFVFQWLLDGYKDLDAVQEHRGQRNVAKLYQAIEKEILNEDSEELPAPVRRMDLDERRRFGKQLTSHFAVVVRSVLGDEVDAELPDELHGLVDKLKADGRIVKALTALTGRAGGDVEGLEEGFLTSMQDFITGILCPALYREPGLTGEELADFRGQEVTNLYLAAVLMTRDNVRSLRKIGEAHAQDLEARVTDDSKLGDAEDVEAAILGDVIDYLANEELVGAVQEAQRELRSAVTARAADAIGSLKDQGSGGTQSDFALVGSHDELGEAISQTAPEPVLVEARAKAISAQVKRAAAGIARAARAESDGDGEPVIADDSADEDPGPARTTSSDGALASILRACGDAVRERSSSGDETPTSGPEAVPAESRTLDERVAAVVARLSPEELQDEETVAKALAEDESFVAGVTRDQVAYYKGLNLIYSRYAEDHVPKEFESKVERLTLANLMLQLSGDLGLGKDGSYLYKLLLDLVVHTDRDNPAQRDFIRSVSLTEYVDTAKIKGNWFFSLEQTLATQGQSILDEVIGFISDLRGIHYLFSVLEGRPDAEVIVVNATADRFVQWVQDDAFGEKGRRLLRVGKLADSVASERKRFIAPALAYITDAAFARGLRKKDWVQSTLEATAYARHFTRGVSGDVESRVLLPPIALSVGGRGTPWKQEGADIIGVSENLAVPLLVVGPSPELNRSEDGFPTVLPAGYLLSAHLLGASGQTIRNPGLDERSSGRFTILGSGAADMTTSLQRLMWGPQRVKRVTRTDDDGQTVEELLAPAQPFAADFYLYVLLTVLAHATNHGGFGRGSDKRPADLFKYVTRSTMSNTKYRQSSQLDAALFWGDALRVVLDGNPAKNGLQRVLLARSPGTNTLGKDELLVAPYHQWFEHALRALALT